MEAFLWGLLSTSSLVIGGLLGCFLPLGKRIIGLIMAFGAGVLISAGAILTMLANPTMPEAFEHGGKLAGLFTVLGFATSVVVVLLERAQHGA